MASTALMEARRSLGIGWAIGFFLWGGAISIVGRGWGVVCQVAGREIGSGGAGFVGLGGWSGVDTGSLAGF